MLKAHTLPNGLKYASYHLPHLRSTVISARVKGGSILDKTKTAGLAHFMEHILMEGIPSFPSAAQLGAYMEQLAGRYNAQTSSYSVSVWFNLPADNLEDGLKLIAETLFSPLFLEQYIEKERSAVINEIQRDKNSDPEKFGEFYRRSRYKNNNPLNIPTLGEIETVSKLTRDDIVEFWSENFVPKNMCITMVGNLPGNLSELLTKYFASYSPGKAVVLPKIEKKDLTERQVCLDHKKDMKANRVSLSFLTDISVDANREAMALYSVVSRILWGSVVSRLFKKLRVDSGLVYDIGGNHRFNTNCGMVDLRTEVGNDNLMPVLEIIVQEIKNFIAEGPTDEEVSRAVNYKINSSMMSFDSPGAIADWIESELMWEETIQLPEEVALGLKEITREKAHKFVTDHWDLSQLNLIIQGPVEDSLANKKALKEIIDRL